MSGLTRLVPWLGSLNYDVTVRSYPVAQAIRRADAGRTWRVLDVGSGAAGVSAFLPGWQVLGLDLALEDGARPQGPFVCASATALPFADGTWDAVTCIDVIEHVPPSARRQILGELRRVCRHLLVVAFPFGEGARAADESLARAYAAEGLAAPPWLEEHLRQEVPTLEDMEPLLEGLPFRRSFNESLGLQRMHRYLGRVSPRAYQAFSLLCALGTPWFARPLEARRSYRCVLSAHMGAR